MISNSFWKRLQNLQKNSCAENYFLNKVKSDGQTVVILRKCMIQSMF